MGAIRGSGWGPRDGEGGGARGMAGGGKTSERGNNGFVPLRRRMFAKRRSREDGAVLGVISEGVNWSRRRLQLIEGKGTTYCAGAGKPECTLLIPSKLPRLEKIFTTKGTLQRRRKFSRAVGGSRRERYGGSHGDVRGGGRAKFLSIVATCAVPAMADAYSMCRPWNAWGRESLRWLIQAD